MATERKVVTVTVFDGELAQGGTPWPDMTDVALEGEFTDLVARVEQRAESCGEYSDGDVITVAGWDEHGHLADVQSFTVSCA